MSILKRFFGPEDRPAWAMALPKGSFEDFCKVVTEGLETRGWKSEYHFDEGYVKVLDGPFAEQELGLHNLARYAATGPKLVWKQVIQEFLASMWQNQEEVDAFMNSTWDQVKPRLRHRVFEPNDVPDGFELVLDPRIDVFCASLYADLTHSAVSVNHETATQWGIPIEEIFDAAIENALRTTPSRKTLPGGWHESADSGLENGMYVHSRCLGLMQLTDAPRGAVFMIPSRSDLLVIEVGGDFHVDQVNAMIGPALSIYVSAPGPVSHRIFWWDRETIVALETNWEGSNYDALVSTGENWRRLTGRA